MNVSAISTSDYANKTAFKGELNSKGKKTGGSGKAWCSAAIPGLGQFLDGRNKEGGIFLGTFLGLKAISFLRSKNLYSAILKQDITGAETALKKLTTKGNLALSVVLSLAGLGMWVTNIVDAYKGKRAPKSTETEA